MRLYTARNRKVKDVPRCLPFTSIENFLQFNDVNEVYNEVVSIYIKNFNLIVIKIKYIYIIYFIIKKSFLFSYLQYDSI